MYKIKESSIKNLFPQHIYNRGLKYFEEGRVTELTYDLHHDLWSAQVHGSFSYFVEIDLENIVDGIVQAYCECPAFANFGSCKHNVAVLLAIVRRQEKGPISPIHQERTTDKAEQFSNQFISAITTVAEENQKLDSSAYKQPMHVQYELGWSYMRNFYIELKTGISYQYVVNDLFTFINDVLTNNEHFFTPKFTYDPKEHYFYDRDLQIFQLLQTIINNEQMYRYQWNYYDRHRNMDVRYLTITPYLFHQLLEQLTTRQLIINIDEKAYDQIEIISDQLPFDFDLKEGRAESLQLEMSGWEQSKYFPEYKALFYNGTFYFPNDIQAAIIEEINHLNILTNTVEIVKDDVNTFLSKALPTLQEIAPVNIEEQLSEQLIQAPLQAKLFLDMNGTVITGKLEYHYSTYKINPFEDIEAEQFYIIRNNRREQEVMDLIEQANFYYNGEELFIETDEESLYEFLYEILPTLQEELDVYLTSAIRRLIIDEPLQLSSQVTVNESSQLLEIGFDLTGIDPSEVQEVLQAVVEKKRYYRLNSGEILSLEKQDLSTVNDIIHELNLSSADLSSGTVELPLYRSTQIDALIPERDYDATFEKLLERLKAPQSSDYELPEGLVATLRPYQKTGYQWFKSLSAYQLGGILADDMGLGKTLQTIAYLLSEPSNHPHLVIAPASVVYNWKSELNRFAPDLTVAMITGSQKERKMMIEQSSNIDVWITSYAMARQDIEHYQSLTFQTLILDEAQYIKNYATKTSQAIRQIKARQRFGLSGTPIENNIDELWAIFQVIMPGFMPNRKQFRELSHKTVSRLTRPFILRRLKEDVLTELPEKIESVIYSELTKEQKELYVGYLQQLQQETTASLKQQPFHQQRMKILAGLTRLRQICCHPSMFIDHYEGTSAKLEQLIELVKTSIDSGSRMLIFSQFTSMHEIIIERLKEEKIDYFYLHGGTTSEERLKMSEAFNHGEKDVFLISLRAGGTGLNLTGADTVILFDLWWNPAVEDQAAGRAHRFGQKNVVQILRLICEGTIEEKIYELQQQKRELIDQVIHSGETTLSSLTEEDIRQLIDI